MMSSTWVWFAVRSAFTLLLLVLLLQVINPAVAFAQLRQVGWVPFAVATLCYLAATLLNTLRWHALLNAGRTLVSLPRLFAYNFSYTFYTVALPGGRLSAEAMRIYQIVRDHTAAHLRSHAVASAFLDRIVAFISFVAIIAVFFILVPKATIGFSLWAIVVAVVVLATATLFAFTPTFILRPLERFLPKAAISVFFEDSPSYRVPFIAWVGAIFFSITADLTFALGAYAIALSVGASVPYIVVLAAFSIGMVAASVPLTIAGIGLREGAFAGALVVLGGVTAEAAAVISAVMLASSFAVVALGGLVEFRRHFLSKI